jgi:hypothetical protein
MNNHMATVMFDAITERPKPPTPEGACWYCQATPYPVYCANSVRHTVVQHNEGVCPRWYDVAGIFEDDICTLCPPPVYTWLDPLTDDERERFEPNLNYDDCDDGCGAPSGVACYNAAGPEPESPF